MEMERKRIQELEKEFARTKNKKIREELRQLKDKQIIEDTEVVKKNLMYLKREFFEFGNKNSKLLARMAKDKKCKREIGILVDEKGKRCNKKTDKCEIVKNFFQKLYSKKEIDSKKLKDYLEKYECRKIEMEHKEKMEGSITQQEIIETIQKLKLGKAPGEDGLPAEFYKEFKGIIVPKLEKLYNKILHGADIPVSWNRSLISLIPKPGKDLEMVESYRPISLINQDAKIFTAILANRLNSFIDNYINSNQVGFVKGRYMSDIIRRVLNILNIAEYNKDRIGILALDIFKAFDSIQWETIIELIKAYGFGDKFIHVISKLYQKGVARVKVNGILTKDIILEAGTRQGCPLSPILFLLAMEILVAKIEEDEDITGYKGVKINLYADDTLIVMKNPEKDIEKIKMHLKEFEELTGLSINWAKSEMLLNWDIKKGKEKFKNQFGIKVKENIRYLGITLSTKINELKKLNYDKLIREIDEKIERYKKLNLSWFGRVALSKMMLLPKFNFLFEMLPIYISEKDMELYQKKIDKFCNAGKRSRIVKKLWYQNQKEGGLGIPKLINYYRSFQVRTVVKIIVGRNELWGKLELGEIENWGRIYFMENLAGKIKVRNNLLNSLLKTWNKFDRKLIPDRLHLGNVEDGDFPIKLNRERKQVLKEENLEGIKEWINVVRDDLKKEEIYEKWKLNWWEKIQVNNWNKKYKDRMRVERSKTEFEEIVSQIGMEEIGIKGLVSKVYKIINLESNLQLVMKDNWGRDLEIDITEQEWNLNWNSRIMRTLSIRIKEHNYKVIWKWYLFPIRLYKMNKGASKLCWRCKVENGTYDHMWYGCRKVKNFWSQIEEEISKIFKKKVKLGVDTILILKLNDNMLTIDERELVRILVIMGRIVIARYWKLNIEYKIIEWFREVWKIALNDKLTCDIKFRKGLLKENIFWRIWQPFVDYAIGNLEEIMPVPMQREFWKI